MPNSKGMKQKTVDGVTFLEGTENIYRDLGFPEAESVNLLARAELMMTIEKAIKEKGLTQSEQVVELRRCLTAKTVRFVQREAREVHHRHASEVAI